MEYGYSHLAFGVKSYDIFSFGTANVQYNVYMLLNKLLSPHIVINELIRRCDFN